MKKKANGYHDILDKQLAYVLLSKKTKKRGHRVQILINPRKRQVRRAGKKGWHLHRDIEPNSGHEDQLITEALKETIVEIKRSS